MNYLPPKQTTLGIFNASDFDYQDKTLTVKELNVTLDAYDTIDTTHTADIATLQTKTTDLSYSSDVTTVAGTIEADMWNFTGSTQISPSSMATNTIAICPTSALATNYT